MRSFIACILLLSFVVFSCEPVSTPDVPIKGELSKVKIEKLEGIPAEYGTLVAVTTHAGYEGWAQLWFVDVINTIRMVRVQFDENRVHEDVLLIPRH